jgi:ABC-type enterobactin transport system permease subunit
MLRFFVGLLLGVVLTGEALAIAGVGHGTYAPLVFTASVALLIPVLGLFAGPLLWAFYFLLIPNLERSWSQTVGWSLVLLAHFGPGFWVAYDDPAFTRADSTQLMVFGITVLVTIGCLLFFCVRQKRTGT